MKNKLKYLYLAILVAPSLTHSQGLIQLLTSFGSLLRLFPAVIFSLSMIYFFWGGVQFIQNAGNEKLRQDGKNKMMWGLVALFVFISIGGILYALGYLLNISTSVRP